MTTTLSTDLDPLLKRLNLANARRNWMHIVQAAEEQNWTYYQFLEMLLRDEIAHRT